MKFDTENELIKDIYQYDVIVLWMDINNSMKRGFLKYIDVNFPDIKISEIKSGYGDLRKLGKINTIKTKNMIFCIGYVYRNNEISIKLLILFSLLSKIKKKRIFLKIFFKLLFFKKREKTPAQERSQERIVDESTVSDVLLRALLSGESISREKAMNIPAVASAVDMISSAVASMPIRLFKYKDDHVVEVKDDDTPETLQRRIMEEAEWKILPEAVKAAGLTVVEVTYQGEWVSVTARKDF